MHLEDFVKGTTLEITNVDAENTTLTWRDSAPDNLKLVLIQNSNVNTVDLAGAVIRPDAGRGVRIVSGDGVLTGVVVEYPESPYGYSNFGIDVQGPWQVYKCIVRNPQIGIILGYMGSQAIENEVYNAEEDHIRFMSGGVDVIRNKCIDHKDTGSKKHRDLIQGVAANYGVGNDGFLENPIIDVTIEDNYLSSKHPDAQGIMFSDGVAIDWYIKENWIDVKSTHGITLNRAQNVEVSRNSATSIINIGSRKVSGIESMGVCLTGNTVKDIHLVNCGPDAVSEFSSNITADGSQITAPMLV